MKRFIVFFLSLFLIKNVSAQTPNYFPLALGNEYQFYFPDTDNYAFNKIERDTLYPNGNLYISLPSIFYFGDSRVDSLGNLLSIFKPFFDGGDPEEGMYFKADAKLGEIWPIAWDFNPVIDTGYAECFFEDSVFLFGKFRSVKGISIFDFSYIYFRYWVAEDIGPVRYSFDDGTIVLLNYAKINGLIYGTPVSVDDDRLNIPGSFSVSQNYPNPFNGITNIDISLPQATSEKTIKLIVYNILGSKLFEREYFVNERITISLNADDILLSSGTYFYAVLNGEERVIKKFTLIK